MNYRLAIRISALSLLLVAGAMVPAGLFAAIDSPIEGWAAAEALGASTLVALLLLGVVWRVSRPKHDVFGRREALLMVALTWAVAPVLAGLPFLLWAGFFHAETFQPHPFQSPINCYFESMSGLTTTGASILPDIEAIPRGLLLWRSTTHWLGGLGIVLLFVAVLPMVGTAGRRLFSFESSGPSPESIRPRIRDTARLLWISYAVITIASAVALRLAGLPWFNAVCEAFGAIATGGFSVRNQSIAAYQSAAVDWIIVATMILGGVNFAIYYELARGRLRNVWRDPELRLFLTLIVVLSVWVAAAIYGGRLITMAGQEVQADWPNAVRYGMFNLVSMHTDSGFSTALFDRWPVMALGIIVVATLIGGSAGSTTGGIKVVRLLVAFKILLKQIQTYVRPGVVKSVRLGKRALDIDEQVAVVLTILLFLLALFGGTVGLMLIGSSEGGMNLATAFTASLANLCTAGPGFDGVGPDQNYLWLPGASKLLLCFLMLIGRLEIVPVLALMHPRFWQRA